MKCKHIKDKLGAYLDGELNEGSAKSIERHLHSCPDCRKELQELRQLSSCLDSISDTRVRETWASEVRKAAEREVDAKITPFALLRDLGRLPNVAAAMVAVALGVLLGAFMSQSVTANDATQQALSVATEQTQDTAEVEYQIQALSATPKSSLEQAYFAATQTSDSESKSNSE